MTPLLLLVLLAGTACKTSGPTIDTLFEPNPAPSKAMGNVDEMPAFPQPYEMRDWKAVARGYDAFLFDESRTGEYLPLLRWDRERINVDYDIPSIPSYVGSDRTGEGAMHEAINTIAAIVGATLVGIDKSNHDGRDYVRMMHGYYTSASGENQFLNRPESRTGGSFWYQTYPNLLAWKLASLYPEAELYEERLRGIADLYCDAIDVMAGSSDPSAIPDFRHTAFNFSEMTPANNGNWREPDTAAAYAWFLYLAWEKWGEERHLRGARRCLDFLESVEWEDNPYYEILLPYGALTAAMLNAHHGTNYDVGKLIDWSFGPSYERYGWGIVSGTWGDYEVAGMTGSHIHAGGFGFSMNTYIVAATLAPIARYDAGYARDMGRWLLNVANTSRLFYPTHIPPSHQSGYEWAERYDPDGVIAYEGLIRRFDDVTPRAMGDPTVLGWGETDFSIYGSSHVGFLGALVETTAVEGVLRIDLQATDFSRRGAVPAYLYYNPHGETVDISMDVGAGLSHVYDSVEGRFILRDVTGTSTVSLPPDGARILSTISSDATLEVRNGRAYADGRILDFDVAPSQEVGHPTRPIDAREVRSRIVEVPMMSPSIDGDISDWALHDGDFIDMDTAGRGDLRLRLRFAWDPEHLYILAKELPGDSTRVEAADGAEYVAAPWSFDGFSLYIDLLNRNVLEDTKDINPWFGLSSEGRTDLFAARTHRDPRPRQREILPGTRVATSGNIDANSRVVEAAIPWEDLASSIDIDRVPGGDIRKAVEEGYTFGCDPLLLDDGYRAQSFLNGDANTIPRGDEDFSIDLRLTTPPKESP